MAINLATKYSKQVVDNFYKESVVAGKTLQNFDFTGVQTVTVSTITTVAPTDYTRTGKDRYGATTEVQDTKQDLKVTQDKAVSLTVDKGNNVQQQMIKNAGKVMALEIREQFIPMFDKHCIKTWSEYTGIGTSGVVALTKDNIVEEIGKGMIHFINKKVPTNNIYCYIKASHYGLLLSSPEFVGNEKLGKEAIENGQVGKVRGAKVIVVPDDYFPKNKEILLVNKGSVLAPMQIRDAKIHEDAPGISGALLEARWLYDAFVLETKKDGLYCIKSA